MLDECIFRIYVVGIYKLHLHMYISLNNAHYRITLREKKYDS